MISLTLLEILQINQIVKTTTPSRIYTWRKFTEYGVRRIQLYRRNISTKGRNVFPDSRNTDIGFFRFKNPEDEYFATIARRDYIGTGFQSSCFAAIRTTIRLDIIETL